MSCESETATLLRESGFRRTSQRMVILNTLRHGGSHMTASEICAAVRASHPYIDISTVYRTLASMRDCRLVAEIDMGTGDMQYEWIASEPHHHLICRSCGSEVGVENEVFEDLRQRLLSEHGFEADLDHLAVHGLCRDCRTKQ